MEFHFCTVVTTSHVPFAKAVAASLQHQSAAAYLHVLVVDDSKQPANTENLRYYPLREIESDAIGLQITERYRTESDCLRWALKPVWLFTLLDRYPKVAYVDSDVFFFNDFGFLFDDLDRYGILLTPHWTPFSPLPHRQDFEMAYRIGIFNAGFIGASRAGMQALRWWASACAIKMANDPGDGYFVDQRYLDMMPVVEPSTGILRHRGCNAAGWNIHQNKRMLKNGQVYINGEHPVVFVHFNQSTLEQISLGHDPHLVAFLEQYKECFRSLGYDYDSLRSGWWNKKPTPVQKVKRSLRLRTRIKTALFKLYERV